MPFQNRWVFLGSSKQEYIQPFFLEYMNNLYCVLML